MFFKNQFTKARIVAYVLSCLLPVAAIAFGIFLLMKDTLFNITFFIGFILLPISTMVGLFFLVFSKIKLIGKIALVLASLFTFLFCFNIVPNFGKMETLSHYENEEVADYQYAEVVARYDEMPELSEVGEPKKIEYYDYFSSAAIFFNCYTDTLICQYDADEYVTQKALLKEKYVFQAENGTAKIEDYTFRIVEAENYPKELLFIATNDQTCEIVYMAFYDDELDYILSLPRFIYEDCGWKYIR